MQQTNVYPKYLLLLLLYLCSGAVRPVRVGTIHTHLVLVVHATLLHYVQHSYTVEHSLLHQTLSLPEFHRDHCNCRCREAVIRQA